MNRRLAKPFLNASSQQRESAAWELIDVVRELFPSVFAELENLGIRAATEGCSDNRDLPADLAQQVYAWTARNRISSDAVDDVAVRFVAGEDWPGPTLTRIRDSKGGAVEIPSITPRPFDETTDEFVARARAHYNEVVAFFKKRGFKKGPVKRERDHFRYLAAHLVGGYSWARIADGDTPLKLLVKSANTVAGEARKAARLIGIQLRSKSGPQPGSRIRQFRRRRPRD